MGMDQVLGEGLGVSAAWQLVGSSVLKEIVFGQGFEVSVAW